MLTLSRPGLWLRCLSLGWHTRYLRHAAGTGVVPDNGGCFRCCSSTHAREPAQGLGGICWRLTCMSTLSRPLLVSIPAVSVNVMHDVTSGNSAATSSAWLQGAGGSAQSQVVEAIIK